MIAQREVDVLVQMANDATIRRTPMGVGSVEYRIVDTKGMTRETIPTRCVSKLAVCGHVKYTPIGPVADGAGTFSITQKGRNALAYSMAHGPILRQITMALR